MGVELLPKNVKHRQTESSACHYSAMEIIGLFFVARHGVLRRIGIRFPLLLQPMQTQKYLIQAENVMFAQSQEHGLLH